MNKTLKRQVFRHTALYAAILMFSHTGGGGGGGGKPIKTLLSLTGETSPRERRMGHLQKRKKKGKKK
ncbi:hypothetical protein [Neisseria gonorrhoeae]